MSWQTFDNKGQVVEQYEPFYAAGWEYLSREEAEIDHPTLFGQKATMYYDPRGQVVRTVNPGGSEQQVRFGTLDEEQLDAPEAYSPTPWESFTYDANDNAGRTHGEDPELAIDAHVHPPEGYQHHWDTPASGVVDALGRAVDAVERNRQKTVGEPIEHHRTRTSYDIRGNVLTLTDAMDREAFSYVYDLADSMIRIDSIDAGIRVMVIDAAGNEVERRDSKGALILQTYDELNRPVRLWARDGTIEAPDVERPTLREHLIYGDGPDAGFQASDPDEPFSAEAMERNLLGALVRHYDEAGLVTVHGYDFKGNLLEKERRVVADDVIPEELPIDWQPPDTSLGDREAVLLDETRYVTTLTYDALNRVISVRYPEDVEGDRKVLHQTYNRAGALEHLELVSNTGTPEESAETYLEHIAYDAKGQRTLVALGNGVMTRYAYDQRTSRLSRLRSEQYTNPQGTEHVYDPTGEPLQDVSYEYDLIGNITTLRDHTPNSGILDSALGRHALDRTFEYDAVYRLTAADGRECGSSIDRQPWDGTPRATGLSETRAYREKYEYNPAGSMTRLRHSGAQGRNGGNQFVRQFSVDASSNRLESMTNAGGRHVYRYDRSGNMLQENAHRHFTFDHNNRMTAFRTRVDGGEERAHYLYNSGGQRVKKVVRRQGGKMDTTVYVEDLWEHHHWKVGGDGSGQNTWLHVMDNQDRIALIRVGKRHPKDTGPTPQYHVSDHLRSSTSVLNDDGNFINREEYTPYGDTSFGSFEKKRYRFTGRERDEETGLDLHGVRYYSPWLCRWTTSDPSGPVDGANLFVYSANNPIRYTDTSGNQSTDVSGTKEESEGEEIPQTAGSGAVTTWDAHQRHKYSRENKAAAKGAQSKIEAARKAGDLESAGDTAMDVSNERNQRRINTRKKLTPGGRIMSEILDKPWSEEELRRKYGNPHESFESAHKWAEGAGKTRSSLRWLSIGGRITGLASTVLGAGVASARIVSASPDERPEVIVEESSAAVGGGVGTVAGVYTGSVMMGALLSNPGGWVILGAAVGGAGLGYVGEKLGRWGGKKINEAANDIKEGLPIVIESLSGTYWERVRDENPGCPPPVCGEPNEWEDAYYENGYYERDLNKDLKTRRSPW